MKQVDLPGLDAQNPLGFLAALGLLTVVDHYARLGEQTRPRLWFTEEGTLVAHIESHLERTALEALVLDDAKAQANNPALQLAYDSTGELVPLGTDGAQRKLKPSPNGAREFLLRCRAADRRAADLASAFFSELIQGTTKGNTKPTAFDFTAGQQVFLNMVEEIRAGIRQHDVAEALQGPWLGTSELPSLAWDSCEARYYALRATNPSGETRPSTPAAYWLALQCLSLLPVVARGNHLATTGVIGNWKDSSFMWPIWVTPIPVPTVASLVRMNLRQLTGPMRFALGVTRVLASRIIRMDYASFSPAEIISPRSL